MVKYKNIPEDVWKRVDKKSDYECWNWLGALNTWGYGLIRINFKNYLTHRIVYQLTYGNISQGLLVLHKCDNTKCCNPNHLFLGTNQDNMDDMIAKGRHISIKGELNDSHKLLEKDILKIKKMYATGNYTQKKLGEIFNVHQTNISHIVINRQWKHINCEAY